MQSILIALILALLVFGGVGYRFRVRLGGNYERGTAFLGLLIVIFLLLLVLGAIHL